MRPLHQGPLAKNRCDLYDAITMHKVYKPRMSDDGRNVLAPTSDGKVQVWYVPDEDTGVYGGVYGCVYGSRPLRLERSADLHPNEGFGEPILARSEAVEPVVCG